MDRKLRQSERTPVRIYKTNARNKLCEMKTEVLPKGLKAFGLPHGPPAKLKPLDKRLAEARLNGLNASYSGHNKSLVDDY